MRGHLHNPEQVAPQRIHHGNSLAIRNTEPRTIISFKCAITVMSRLAVSLAGRSSPDNGRAFLEPKFLNEALHRCGQQQTPALSAFHRRYHRATGGTDPTETAIPISG